MGLVRRTAHKLGARDGKLNDIAASINGAEEKRERLGQEVAQLKQTYERASARYRIEKESVWSRAEQEHQKDWAIVLEQRQQQNREREQRRQQEREQDRGRDHGWER